VADFYLERALATPFTAIAERSLWKRLQSCAHAHPVRWHECLVDGDRQRIVWRVEAEDLPAARAAALCSGVESDANWLSAVPWAEAPPAVVEAHAGTGAGTRVGTRCGTHAGLIDVLAECRRDAPIDIDRLVRDRNMCDWCLDTLRVEAGPLATSADGRRVVAFFRAPDAEAVRNAHRYATIPFDRVTAVRRLDPAV
jgi:hypothetical protein